MTESEAVELVAVLAAAYPRQPVSEATLRVYACDLLGLDAGLAHAACTELRRSSRFFPTIAEIRTAVAERALEAPGQAEAWNEVQEHGDLHPLVDRARRITADPWEWQTLPAATLRRSFAAAYGELRAQAIRELVTAETPVLEPAVSVPELGPGE